MVRLKHSKIHYFITLNNFRGASGSWIIEAPQATPMVVGGTAVWVATSGTDIPAGAFVGGEDNGEGLVVGRALHEGALLPGSYLNFCSCKLATLMFLF